jgi:TonB family protein
MEGHTGCDEELEGLLRQFQPRRPPPLRTSLVTPSRMMIAAGIATASAVPIAWLWHAPGPPTQVGPTIEDRAVVPAPALPRARSAPAGRLVRRPLRVGEDIASPPIKVYHVDPVYPDDANVSETGGAVILQIIIGIDGSVRNAEVVRSVPGSDQAAIDAVLQWEFMPTLLDGEPVEIEMDVVVNFLLP